MRAAYSLLILLFGWGSGTLGSYLLQDTYVGPDFLSGWTWETFDDPTHGRVNYVDQETALAKNLAYATNSKFIMRVDSFGIVSPTARGRDSIRIRSDAAYNDSIMVLDLSHMPWGCGTWPAFWTISKEGPWPCGAEIDVIEGVNVDTKNLASLHTSPNCSMTQDRSQSGFTVSTECDASLNYNQGCGTRFSKLNTYGQDFNKANGGWFVMKKSRDEGVRVWFWSRNEESVPRDIRGGLPSLDTSDWGTSEASFPGQSCDYDAHFNEHQMIFDTTLCGDWAGNQGLYAAAGCPGSCAEFVDNNPSEFTEAYWEINSLRVYVPAPSILSI